MVSWGASSSVAFQSTPPGWEATRTEDIRSAAQREFQSTPPGWEATVITLGSAAAGASFQSTPPGWEATAKIYEEWSDSLEFLLNSPRGVLLIGGVWLLLLENVCQFRVVLAVRRRRRIHERLGFALRFVCLNALLLQL